jgi:hypothetical protein
VPDVLKQTVSASQIAGIYNRSPWETRWSLWHWFRNSVEIAADNSRTDFGKFCEPFIMAQVQERLRLEVQHNAAGEYKRKGSLGCSRDARIFDPTRGEGIIQAKTCARQIWKETYTDSLCPPHIEMQLQCEMAVHDAAWGIVAVMIGQNDQLFLYERQPNKELQARMEDEARAFLDSVAAGQEPSPFGSAVELPVLDALYPTVTPGKVITMTDETIAEAARMMRWADEQSKFFSRVYDQKRAIIAAAAGDAQRLELPGVMIEISRSSAKGGSVNLPAEIAIGLLKTLTEAAAAGIDPEPIRAAATWSQTTRAESVRTKFRIIDTAPPTEESKTWLTP